MVHRYGLRTFLSKVSDLSSSVFLIAHVSEPYRMMGRINVVNILIFKSTDVNLVLSRLPPPDYRYSSWYPQFNR